MYILNILKEYAEQKKSQCVFCRIQVSSKGFPQDKYCKYRIVLLKWCENIIQM